ncbi:hypothetical protein FOQG_18585 [Fusarium oxysporum f. sp. raphani 54005]|uniref:Uncharacterized protein n=1 Tax=Fusarium oxysporum f. sp. raphani 54005 TaxID=1089458 RepID=X0B3K6_FUSOX|nr:hypothetical protein FOQG_18585 [Fusarium oxysporum f. sp. raphani 54005]
MGQPGHRFRKRNPPSSSTTIRCAGYSRSSHRQHSGIRPSHHCPLRW